MKQLLNIITVGMFLGLLFSCAHTNQRKISGQPDSLVNEPYGVLKTEITDLLERTSDLKQYKVAQPEFL